jgi:nitroreductase
MNYEDFLALLKARRSVRAFRSDPIPDDAVDKIIEAARFSPSGGNSQPWEFIVIKDPETRDKIVQLVADQGAITRKVELTREEELRFPGTQGPARAPGFKDAPVFIVLCGDPRTREAYPRLTLLTRGDSHFASSLANAFFSMTLAAVTLGLGAQWVSATGSPFVSPLLKELLAIPEDLSVYDMMALGYPAAQPKERFIRERSDMVHYGCYDRAKYRNAREMRDFILRLRKG